MDFEDPCKQQNAAQMMVYHFQNQVIKDWAFPVFQIDSLWIIHSGAASCHVVEDTQASLWMCPCDEELQIQLQPYK